MTINLTRIPNDLNPHPLNSSQKPLRILTRNAQLFPKPLTRPNQQRMFPHILIRVGQPRPIHRPANKRGTNPPNLVLPNTEVEEGDRGNGFDAVEVEGAGGIGEVVVVDEEFIVGAKGKPVIRVDDVSVVWRHVRSDKGGECT
jgi:hypothetical protein